MQGGMMQNLDKLTIFTRAAELLQDFADDPYAEVREDYSGRGMYGDSVPAIVTMRPEMVGWAVSVAALELADDVEDQFGALDLLTDGVLDLIPTRQDNMGRDSMVVY